MYKVMLVDDDYPVLEFLANTIPWEKLGLTLTGTYENGAVALEAAQKMMPDIVVTDIGMPRMNGLELIRALKELEPRTRFAILSCHSEFHYAQQAMKLSVQDYLVKDTLDPEDMEKLLAQFKASLDEETKGVERQNRMRQMIDRNRERHKETFLRGTIHEPILDGQAWLQEAEAFGLRLQDRVCLPVACYIDDQRLARQRFVTDDVLRFAVNNILEEILGADERGAVNFTYDVLRSFILIPAPGGIKTNPYDEAVKLLARVQSTVYAALKLKLSFIIGRTCGEPSGLKQELTGLLGASGQRFYMRQQSMEKREQMTFSEADLFSCYDEAASGFRGVLLEGGAATVQPVLAYWTGYLRAEKFRPETVKDWVLKLVLDLKLKLQSMQLFRNHYSVEILHKELLEMDTLDEIEAWVNGFFESSLTAARDAKVLSKRTEVLDACHYVSQHLNRKISLDEVAEHLYMNPSYFSRLFKKETGETFIEFVNRAKVNRAKELLDGTNLSVAKICEALGYDNHSYFIKMFKAAAGVTPQEYRGTAPVKA
ncbi:response regulator transcription factor [Paenibacillus mucilaginosus]|uniref:AraC family transcriptional regulator n=2 Tax=Paenibacillus mucilaginosus TaxID=61624 RepID=H6NA90_9BACL|nr:helix-turn-helix domain-containing protein [Paenibacillus mucilaginosus]AEI40728.1 two component transcriptional regulator, AraC family [Paenibacillus mucilaginosus KNP414]AFC29336.1 AraC family transcriptional regulator [Paenibacillus mucilaginosus 3016]MCG7211790.1 helix-turn-helix domain-containing protein [Paenibacillus mucilaginosus]WDM29859.1 helix-turn-helix domain-containing protein [Paenibacillus mucilaginosus]WFA18054.1 helix-turn-helix domain-containing protein [Paenibacillus muc